MKIALVHDYLIQDGGAERVLQAFHEMWPEAPIFVLLHDTKRFDAFRGGDIRTSFLQQVPLSLRKFKWLMPLMPAATERHRLDEFDVVLTSTSAFAKGVITRPETLHVCYCHTPTRYLWSDTHSYISEIGLPRPVRAVLPMMLTNIRMWDRLAAERVDRFVANSRTVRGRIRKYYQRDSDVIHPPVDTGRYAVAPKVGDYYLAGGRLVAYKRYDVVVRAFNRLGIPLKIFGEGPEMGSLRREAKRNVEFVGRVSEDDKAELYSNCIAYLHPQEEDFGITPVEAMAAGRPVIAYAKGGAMETVVEGLSGTFIEDQSWEELANCIIRFRPESYDPAAIRQHALAFDVEEFKRKMHDYVKRARLEQGTSAGRAAERTARREMQLQA